jgi:hypothetical protein
VAGVSAAVAETNEGPDTWSPHDVVAHLVYCERDNWMARARVIRSYGLTAQFPPFSPDGHFAAALHSSPGAPRLVDTPLETLLDTFAAERAAHVELLAAWQLAPADLTREGVHPTFGRVTLRQLLAAWVAHDLAHLAQITRVLAKHYQDEVGPWRPLLSILNR